MLSLSKTQLAVLSLITANIIWGAAAPIFKWSLDEIQPFTLAFLRFSLAAAILFPFVRHNLKIHRSHWLILIFISIIGLGIKIGYYFTGLKLASSINVPIIFSAAPIFIIIGSTILLHEKPKRKVISGTLISLFGILIVILQPLFDKSISSSVLGNVLFIISMGLSVFYTLLLKEISPKYNPLTLTFWIFTITSISFLPFLFIEAINTNQLLHLDTKSIIGITFGAVLCSTIAYTLHTFAIKYIAANEVAVFSYIDPVITIIIAKPLLGETASSTFLLGSALVFIGIFISEGRIHYHPIHLLRRKAKKHSIDNDLSPNLNPNITQNINPNISQKVPISNSNNTESS
jgi:drug/metabolite transporter (DMT)-like permease